ncbi:MAG: TetR/AcrR family transcriptional regulator [Erysipelotrichaceae bacterium]
MNYRKKNLITKKDIKDGFLELLDEKGFDKITVSELCQKVGINRSTFYYYYDNMNKLLQDVHHDYFDSIIEKLNMNHYSLFNQTEVDEHLLISLLKDIRYNDSKLKLFLEKADKYSFFVNAMDYFYDAYSITEKDKIKKYEAFSCFSNGFILVSCWVKSGYDLDEKVLCQMIAKLKITL